jgi:hypothetical protein
MKPTSSISLPCLFFLSASWAQAHTLRECSNAAGSIWIRNDNVAVLSTTVDNRSGQIERTGTFSTQDYSIQWLGAPKITSSSVSKDDCGNAVREWHGVQTVILTPRDTSSKGLTRKIQEAMICHQTVTEDSCRN